MTNLTIAIDENLVKQARIKAIQEGTSLSAKVREMLSNYVRQPEPSALASVQALAQLPTSQASGGVLPGVDPLSNRSINLALNVGPNAAMNPDLAAAAPESAPAPRA